MSSKSEAAYTDAFKFIKANLFDLKPTSIQTDFESALRNAIKNVYPEVIMKPCWFHYIQALRRNALKIPQFKRYLNSNTSAKRHFNKFFFLPLLKPSDLVSGFEFLKAKALSSTYANHKDAQSFFVPFIEYFEKQWIRKESADYISIYKEKTRTTSAAEGYNSQLSAKLAKNGNFLKFLDVILDQDCVKSADLIKSVDGHVHLYKNKNKSKKCRDVFIENALRNFENGTSTLNDVFNQFTCNKKILICDEENTNINTEQISNNSDNDDDTDNDDSGGTNKNIISDKSDPLLCEICYQNKRSILLIPCNHYKICLECYESIKKRYVERNVSMLCPICRQIVEKYSTIYM